MSVTPASRGRIEPMSCAGCDDGGDDCLGAALAGGAPPQGLTRRALAKGEHLCRAGDPVDYLFVVASGALKSYVLSSAGEEQVLGFHLPGDIVAIDSIIRPRHHASTSAIAPARVCRLPAATIQRHVDQSPRFRERLVVRMGWEIQQLQRLLQLGRRSAEQRVAGFLVMQARKLEAEGLPGRAPRLPLSRVDIGRHLDLATETVSRVVSRLQRQGVVHARRGSVEIRNMARLLALARDDSAAAAARGRPRRPLPRLRD